MSLLEILSQVHVLPRSDKIRLLQVLVDELAKEEGLAPLEPGGNYPVWSPHNAFEAADTMLEALERSQDNG